VQASAPGPTLVGRGKLPCPICYSNNYGHSTLEVHLWSVHGHRPLLVKTIVGLVASHQQPQDSPSTHDRYHCLLCQIEYRKHLQAEHTQNDLVTAFVDLQLRYERLLRGQVSGSR